GPRTFAVSVHVSDGHGHQADSPPMTLTLDNTAPTATLSAPASAPEGGTVTVSLTNPFDPSQADTDAGFHYAFALDGGSLAGPTSATTGATPPAAVASPDGPGAHTVRPRVIDQDGGFTESTALVHIDDVAPTARLTGPADGFRGVRGQLRTLSLGATD